MENKLRNIVFPITIVLLLTYFTYHIFQGQRGILAWIRLDKKLQEQEIVLSKLTQEKEKLEREAYLLRPDSLDIDLLEEKSRQLLNFAHSNEIVIQN
ncbi:MAG: FtsB family cell division protein [Pseudomonadota bacterium]|jgi:cell division protein FtsB|nr:septum formation initiator family protein [Alphaproteobacteria bacterium]